MRYLLIGVFSLSIMFCSSGQTSSEVTSDTERISIFQPETTLSKKRLITISSSICGVWAGSIIGLQTIWYNDTIPNKFKFFDDSKNWLQMDKVGHVYTAYQLNRLTTGLYLWTGLDNKKATWIGFGISTGFQTTLEILDGFSGTWGWSWADVASNTFGSALYTSQQLIWEEQRILPKFSYSPSPFASVRPEVLGSTFAESFLKDYNGQSYWISFSPGSFLSESRIPKWACLSFGYSAHEKLVGSQPTFTDPFTGITYHEQREFLFSFDIDFSQLDIKKPWLKTIVKQFNYLKVPFPTMILRNGQVIAHPFYF